MNRTFRHVATLAALLLVGFAASGAPRAAEPDRVPPQNPRHPDADDDTSGSGTGKDYRLDRLHILSRVIVHVKDNYVDPKRIDPKAMVVAALDAVEKTVAEVMVDGDAKGGKLTVTVGAATRQFDISDVDSIWKITPVMHDIMGFIQEHLVAHENVRDIEYAAVNGMLGTLDPHSVMLEPKYYKEMKLQTKGEFGGLGFVISMREGNLTVVKVLKNTPAQRAGVKPKDVISKIEEQSTINMELQEAVDHLRGKPNTKVSITVSRPTAPDPKRMSLVREVINVESVPTARLLDNGVGYVRVSQFSANTTRDLVSALNQQKAQNGGNIKGLVLDLRGNPGGLLEQAIQVSDLFLSDGVIVSTVGEGDRVRLHEVKEAHADRDDMTSLPIVLLMNNSSASASEIVAGALRNNNRALVVGRRSFGKGSVQVLYDFVDPMKPTEESALKLTIAQYLTPGDISIQEVGITPDVLLLPGRALKESVSLWAPPRVSGEADLEKHFVNAKDPVLEKGSESDAARRDEAKRRQEKAALELRYVMEEKEDKYAQQLKADAKKEEAKKLKKDKGEGDSDVIEETPEQTEDANAESEDEFVEDFQIRFAKELLARAPFAERQKLLEAAKGFAAEKRNDEELRVKQRLEAMGIDWSSGAAPGRPQPIVTVTPAAGQKQTAGDTMQWTVTVENKGDGPLRRLRAWTLCEKNPILDRKEFVFGAVKPGEKRTWSVSVKLPKDLASRRDEVTLHFEEENGKAPPDQKMLVDVAEIAKPSFAFSTQVDDDATGNGNGLIEKGEEITLRVDVKNEGTGKSGEKTYVAIRNLGDDKVFIKKGRFSVGALKPGESKSATFSLEVKKGLKGDKVPLRLLVVDEKMDEFVSEKVELPALAAGPGKTVKKGSLKITDDDAILRGGADAAALPVAVAKKGAVVTLVGKAGDFYKVEWAKGRFGFVPTSLGKETPGKPSGTVTELWQKEPPRISLAVDTSKGPQVVETEKYHLEGSALVPTGPAGPTSKLRDLFVFVNDQKVFFKVAPTTGETKNKVDFATDFVLKPGNNTVTVFAREDEEFQTRKTIVVHRKAPEVSAQRGVAERPAAN